jgi:hypothetical protein
LRGRAKSFFIAVLILSLPTTAWPVSSTEEKLLAAFIFNITKFTHWNGASDKGPLRITVIENQPVAQALLDATQGKSVGSRKLEIIESTVEKIGGAGVTVLIPTAGDPRALLGKLKGCRCLINAKKHGLPSAGAMINFDNK